MKMTSIARDIYDEIPLIGKDRLNTAHAYGGPNLTMKAINTLFDLNVTQYVTINFHGLADIVDLFGGVYIDLTPEEIPYLNENVAVSEDYEGFEKKEGRVPLPKDTQGLTKLDGLQAVAYARIRYADNDFGRNQRQRVLLEAMMDMVVVDATSKKLLMLAGIMVPYVDTNMPLPDMVRLGNTVLKNGTFAFEEFSVPSTTGAFTYAKEGEDSVLIINLKTNTEALHTFIYGEYIPR